MEPALPRAPAPAPGAEPRRRVLRHHRLVAAAGLQPEHLDGRGRGARHRRAPGGGGDQAAEGAQGKEDLGLLVPPQGIASYRLAADAAAAGDPLPGGPGRLPAPPATELSRRHPLHPPPRPIPTASAATLDACSPRRAPAAGGLLLLRSEGLSLGSNDMSCRCAPVRVGLVSGEGVDATSFGFLWYLLDRQIGATTTGSTWRSSGRSTCPTSTSWSCRAATTTTASATSSEDALGRLDQGRGRAGGRRRRRHLAAGRRADLDQALGGRRKEDAEESEPEDPEPRRALDERRSSPPAPCWPPACSPTTRSPWASPPRPAVLYEGSMVLKATGDPAQDVLVARDDDPVVAGFAWPEAEAAPRRLAPRRGGEDGARGASSSSPRTPPTGCSGGPPSPSCSTPCSTVRAPGSERRTRGSRPWRAVTDVG